jgi:hypothetical protein
MFPYFEKLKTKFTLTEFQSVEERVSYGKRISYTKVKTPHRHLLYSTILEEYRKLFGLTLMRITDQVPPHTDSRIKTCINFYIKTENARTIFYEPISSKLDKFQVANQTDGFVYDAKNLQEVTSFTAQPGDAFVLNVTKIHSVLSPNPISERIALTLGTEMEFTNVLRILYATSNLEINTRNP